MKEKITEKTLQTRLECGKSFKLKVRKSFALTFELATENKKTTKRKTRFCKKSSNMIN